MPEQLCSHPLPQLSKELHGVISALGNAQGLCPEWETLWRRLPQHNRQGNPGESSPVPGRAPAHPCTSPPAALRQRLLWDSFPRAPSLPGRYSRSSPRSQPRAVPPAAVTISLLTPQPHWKHRQEQRHLLPREGWGCEQGHDRTVAVVGTRPPRSQHSGAESWM